MKEPVLKITDLQQVCIVVHDVDRAVQGLWEAFGIGPWNVFINRPAALWDTTYMGKPASFGYKVAKTQGRVGSGLELEIIQPLEGRSIYTDFLESHGEGLQHIGRHLATDLQDLAEITKRMEEAGFQCIMSGRNSFCAFAYFDTERLWHTVMEVIWVDPAGKPVPDRVFPA